MVLIFYQQVNENDASMIGYHYKRFDKGRNIHALDPYRIPSEVALIRGTKVANDIINSHYEKYKEYPQSVAVTLWGLDTIKTKVSSAITRVLLNNYSSLLLRVNQSGLY
jgi:hypothetical protein